MNDDNLFYIADGDNANSSLTAKKSLVDLVDYKDDNVLRVNSDISSTSAWSSWNSPDLNTLVGTVNFSDIKIQGTTSTSTLYNNCYWPNTTLSSASSYSWKLPTKYEVLEIISTIFNKYGFNYNVGDNTYNSSDEQIISREHKNNKIFGWICCGEIKSIRLGNLLYPWDHIISDLYMDQDIVTLEASKDAYFDDFSIRVLLDSHIVFVDFRGKNIINIIQDTILENLNSAFEDIQTELTNNSSGTYGGYYSNYDLDTVAKIDNNGHII